MGCCVERDIPLSSPSEHPAVQPVCASSEGSVDQVQRLEYQPLVQPTSPTVPQSTPTTESKQTPARVDFRSAPKSASFNTEVLMLKDREAYAMTLIEGAEKWIIDYETEELVVKFLSGSKFAKEVPVAYFYLDFGIDIGFDTVLAALESLTIRQEWDESIQTLEITKVEDTEYETCYTKFLVFGMERDFVERRHRVLTEQQLTVAFFSVMDSHYPHSDSRATTHFGLYRVGKSQKGTTNMLLFTQYDYRLYGELLQKFNSHRGEAAKGWLEAFKAQVLGLNTQ